MHALRMLLSGARSKKGVKMPYPKIPPLDGGNIKTLTGV